MLLTLKDLLDYPRNIWTANQKVMDCDPSLKRFPGPLIILLPESVYEKTQQTASFKN
jgi:hypothetical protein